MGKRCAVLDVSSIWGTCVVPDVSILWFVVIDVKVVFDVNSK